MATPFIAFQEPTSLAGYDRTRPPDAQVVAAAGPLGGEGGSRPTSSHSQKSAGGAGAGGSGTAAAGSAMAIPKTFRDAMSVREAVFVREQGVPLEYEHDADDARSCHWVLYASVNRKPRGAAAGGGEEGKEPSSSSSSSFSSEQQQQHQQQQQQQQIESNSLPIATLRIVPFPHPPHPPDGAWYEDGRLCEPPHGHRERMDAAEEVRREREVAEEKKEEGKGKDRSKGGEEEEGKTGEGAAPPSTTTAAAAAAGISTAAKERLQAPRTLSASEEEREGSALPYGADRATSLHDGREPYVKLGRMAVLPDFRGRRASGQLWRSARRWLEDHPSYFDPSVAARGMHQLRAGSAGDIPRWSGLVCAHAQEAARGVYERWGFRVDEGMGRWHEEGIPHVGMFIRLNVARADPTV